VTTTVNSIKTNVVLFYLNNFPPSLTNFFRFYTETIKSFKKKFDAYLPLNVSKWLEVLKYSINEKLLKLVIHYNDKYLFK